MERDRERESNNIDDRIMINHLCHSFARWLIFSSARRFVDSPPIHKRGGGYC